MTTLPAACLDVVWPTPCPSCGAAPARTLRSRLCAPCAAALPRLLHWGAPPAGVQSAWWLADYRGPLGALIRRGKHHPDHTALREAAALLASAAAGRLPQVDAVAAVPTTLRRAWSRGTNPAAVLAGPVARRLGVPVRHPLRRLGVGKQVGRTAGQRRQAAAASYRADSAVSGRWLLIDDVWTTGATASACASELLGAGAARVFFLAAARAAPPHPNRVEPRPPRVRENTV